MDFSTHVTVSPHQIKTAALAIGVFADGVLSTTADIIDRASQGAVRAVVKSEFQGRTGSTLILRDLTGVTATRIVLVGLGKQADYNARAQAAGERAFAQVCVQARLTEGTSCLAGIAYGTSTARDRARIAASSVGEASYHYDASFGKPDPDARPKLKKVSLLVAKADQHAANEGLKEGRALAQGMSLARTLGNMPGNLCTPTYLGDTAKKLGREFKSIKVNVLDRKQIEALGMGSFLSVAKGSAEPPRSLSCTTRARTPSKRPPKAKVLLCWSAKGLPLTPVESQSNPPVRWMR